MSTAETEDGPHPQSGTAQGMVDFLGYVIDNHYMNGATASALRTGVKKVLEAETDLDAIDIRHADLDDILHRFHFRARGKMKDKSVEVYESRFRSSVEMYRKWLDKDKDWLPASARTRKPSGNTPAPSKRGATSKTSKEPAAAALVEHELTLAPSGPGLITYPFPIRAGMQGKITLPENLSSREAERISAFIKTLAIEDDTVYSHSPRLIEGTVVDER
jgi:hypothetical protein